MTTVAVDTPTQTSSRTSARVRSTPAAVEGAPCVLLRTEGAAVLASACAAYAAVGGNWWMFALLFLVPDLSMLGYLAGPRLGAMAYNIGHTYLTAFAVGAIGWSLGMPMLVHIALIWTAHIGFDRLMGYGLKYATGFGDTHLRILTNRRFAAWEQPALFAGEIRAAFGPLRKQS